MGQWKLMMNFGAYLVSLKEKQMTIKRGGMAEPISGNIYTREIPTYCEVCHYGRMIKRQYKEHELIAGEIPPDHDQWRQCEHCGEIVARHDIPQQGELTTDVERITTKFTTQKVDEHYQPPKHRRGFNERLSKEDDGIKDPEVKAALKKGAKLISYSER